MPTVVVRAEERPSADAAAADPPAKAAPEREDEAAAEEDMAEPGQIFDARTSRTGGETGIEKERHMQGKEIANVRRE